MPLDNPATVDSIRTDVAANAVVLCIFDSWGWVDVEAHLVALRAKLSAYLAFIRLGQLVVVYPAAVGKRVVIEVVTRVPLAPVAAPLFNEMQLLARAQQVELVTRVAPLRRSRT